MHPEAKRSEGHREGKAKARARTKPRAKVARVERYRTWKELRAALDVSCCRELGEPMKLPGDEIARGLKVQLESVRAMAEDTSGRDACNGLRRALSKALELLRREDNGRRQRTAYSAELFRITKAVSWWSDDPDEDLSPRRLLVLQIAEPLRSQYTHRQIALLSLVAGNGKDWAMEQFRKAKESGIASNWPSVNDAVRAEERVIGLVRKREADRSARR